jgi:hypothetical protein
MMPSSRELDSMRRTLSKMKYNSVKEPLYLIGLGTAVPNVARTALKLKEMCDDFDVNIVYMAHGKCFSGKEASGNKMTINRAVVGLSPMNYEPQYEVLETEELDSKKKAFGNLGIV